MLATACWEIREALHSLSYLPVYIAPHVAESDSNAAMRYTMGIGGVGLEREAYYAGWLVISDLLAHGWTFPRLARVPDGQMPGLVSESLARIQKSPPAS